MGKKQVLIIIAAVLPLFSFLVPKPATAEVVTWGRWGRGWGHRGGIVFGTGSVVVSPPPVYMAPSPIYVSPPSVYVTPSYVAPSYVAPALTDPPSVLCTGYQQVLVAGHWEYINSGQRYYVPDHYECRS